MHIGMSVWAVRYVFGWLMNNAPLPAMTADE